MHVNEAAGLAPLVRHRSHLQGLPKSIALVDASEKELAPVLRVGIKFKFEFE